MATTKVTITVEPDEHRRLIAAVDCYFDWTRDFISDTTNSADMRRKASQELPKIEALQKSL